MGPDGARGGAGAGAVEIRDVTAADVPRLERVLPSDGDHARQLANAVAGRRAFLAAWSGGEPVGTVVVRWAGVPVDATGSAPEIGSLVVVAGRRGEGIGGRLVAAGEQRVRERGGATAAIVVAGTNDGARRLYGRLGYRDTGRRRHLPGGPGPDGVRTELVLVRSLDG